MIIRLLILMLFVAGCGGAAGVNPTSTSGPVSATEGVTLSTVVKAPATASASLSRSLKSVTNSVIPVIPAEAGIPSLSVFKSSVIPAQAGIPASRVSKATADISAIGVNGDQTNNSSGQSGAVYVFARSGSTWTQQAYIKASNTDAGDAFGYSVAISGDTLAVGAQGEDSKATGINGDQTNNSASGSGAAYVFAP